MANLFFNSEEEIVNVSHFLFTSLGIRDYIQGDSQNVLDGIYYSYSIFGVSIKLELNSYDFEDKYKYMLRISKELTSDLKVNSSIVEEVSSLVLKLLIINVPMDIAIEKKDGELEIIRNN